MSSWKTLPIGYRGELHDVELVQFSLDLEEAARALPPPLVPRRIAGRALVSLVHVRLRRMRPTFLPGLVGFSYRHVAFRLLVDDPALAPPPPSDPEAAGRGIFFVRSFTDRPLLAHAGNLLTHYRLTPAELAVDPRGLAVREGGRRLSYRKAVLGAEVPSPGLFGGWAEARAVVGALDRAYAVDPDGGVWETRIKRPDWPLEPLALAGFATDFFESARLECAFRVASVIPYHWLAPVRVR
ncbi:MAG TPA: DUF2071 domain-containing protein [Thermoanaerobaculia bacterium]|nr:DUF2071 domain-containing protein [Thermoanaerobaculia bacterium]